MTLRTIEHPRGVARRARIHGTHSHDCLPALHYIESLVLELANLDVLDRASQQLGFAF